MYASKAAHVTPSLAAFPLLLLPVPLPFAQANSHAGATYETDMVNHKFVREAVMDDMVSRHRGITAVVGITCLDLLGWQPPPPPYYQLLLCTRAMPRHPHAPHSKRLLCSVLFLMLPAHLPLQVWLVRYGDAYLQAGGVCVGVQQRRGAGREGVRLMLPFKDRPWQLCISRIVASPSSTCCDHGHSRTVCLSTGQATW